jgi:GH35 family endo-1,4-beta-xylanase
MAVLQGAYKSSVECRSFHPAKFLRTVHSQHSTNHLNPNFKMTISTLLSSLLLAFAVGSANGQTLKSVAGSRYFGAALAQSHLQNASDPKFAQFGAQQFSGATPENEMKWQSTEPTQGTFTFSGGDAIVQFAKQNSKLLGSHICIAKAEASQI